LVTFDHFVLFNEAGPSLVRRAPLLARRLYGNNVRVLLHGLSQAEQREAARLLRLARHASPSRTQPAIVRGKKHLCRAPGSSARPAEC
jgi:hypothetical protein